MMYAIRDRLIVYLSTEYCVWHLHQLALAATLRVSLSPMSNKERVWCFRPQIKGVLECMVWYLGRDLADGPMGWRRLRTCPVGNQSTKVDRDWACRTSRPRRWVSARPAASMSIIGSLRDRATVAFPGGCRSSESRR